jgi:hypothetical protein
MKEFLDRYKTGFQLQDWQKTGLLSSLAADQEPQMVEIFEKSMPYVLNLENEDKQQVVLPIFRRIYTELVTGRYSNDDNKLLLYLLIDVDDVLDQLDKLYETVLPSLYDFKHIDAQAEFCVLITRDYINKLHKQISKDPNGLSNKLKALSRDRKISKIL